MVEDKAAVELEEELGRINERFESGEMKAFGRGQEKLLAHFDEIRRTQRALSARQIAMSGERMKGSTATTSASATTPATATATATGDDVSHALEFSEGKLTELAAALGTICKDIEETNQVIRREARLPSPDV